MRVGNTITNACILTNVGLSTFFRYLEQGEAAQKGSRLRENWEAIKRSQAEAQNRNVVLIQDAARRHWQAAAWFLERTNPKEWALKQVHEVSGPAGAEIAVNIKQGFDPARVEKLLRDHFANKPGQ